MKMMFNTNASKGEKIPATSTPVFRHFTQSILRSTPFRPARFGSWQQVEQEGLYHYQ
jgi:hypothetical protein